MFQIYKKPTRREGKWPFTIAFQINQSLTFSLYEEITLKRIAVLQYIKYAYSSIRAA